MKVLFLVQNWITADEEFPIKKILQFLTENFDGKKENVFKKTQSPVFKDNYLAFVIFLKTNGQLLVLQGSPYSPQGSHIH